MTLSHVPQEEIIDAKSEPYTECIKCFVPLLVRRKGGVKKKTLFNNITVLTLLYDCGYVENSSLRSGKYCQPLFLEHPYVSLFF